MKAVILVGGFGTRLRPLTLNTPKQMLPVVGRTMLERVVDRLVDFGIDEVVLSLGYRPELFTEAFPDGICGGARLVYAVEPEPLDTAGAVAFAADAAGVQERFLALNGDVLCDLDLSALIDQHAGTRAAATISLTPVDDPSRYGVVPLHPDGRVEAFIEKPDPGTAPSHWINAGCYVIEPEVLDLVPRGEKVSIERDVFPALVERGELYGLQSDDYWIDAGTPEAYLAANLDYLDGSRGEVLDGIHPEARISAGATVSNSVIGARCVIAEGCSVVDSVLLEDVEVAGGAVVDRSIIGAGASVGERSRLCELSVIGPGVPVPPDTAVSGERIPGPHEWEAAPAVPER